MRARVRLLAGVVVLGLVVAAVGTGPVVDGVRSLGPGVLGAGLLLGLVSTVACAVRWRLVAGRLGAPLTLPTAVAACYRAQLLNTVLPAGVLGDVDRGLGQARATGRPAAALRAVGWERVAGQVVQATVTLGVLVLVPSPLRAVLPALVVAVALLAAAGLLALRVLDGADARSTRRTGGRPGRMGAAVRGELRAALRVRQVWLGVVAASSVALAAHVTTYVLAARATGNAPPLAALVPLALVVLVAAGVPLNVAGWGPREGVAAWASSVTGLGAAAGLSTAVAFGTIVLVANLPGVVVLVAGRAPTRGRRRDPVPTTDAAPARSGGGAGA